MKIKVSEASGYVLDYLVASREGQLSQATQARNFVELCRQREGVALTHARVYSPSTNPVLAYPIIERERIATYPVVDMSGGTSWGARIDAGTDLRSFGQGSTPLIAAMRCFIASIHGTDVEVPDELIEATPGPHAQPSQARLGCVNC